ncbi:unnamed protein product [Prunus armeniaca]
MEGADGRRLMAEGGRPIPNHWGDVKTSHAPNDGRCRWPKADCRGAEGFCRRALKKGRMTEALCVDSHRRRQTVDAQKWFGTFEANLVMGCDG